MKKPATTHLYGDPAYNIASSDDFIAFPMGSKYREISSRIATDYSSAIQLLESLPVFLSGDEHKERRKSMAVVYAQTRKLQEKAIDQVVDEVAQSIEHRHGAFNLIDELSTPLWTALRNVICTESREVKDLASELPELFYPGLSPRRRKSLNNKLTNILKSGNDQLLNQIALLTLGVRPFSASLALSIHKIARDNDGKRLCDIVFPTSFPDSALTYVDRISLRDTVIDGCPFSAGSRIRCTTFDSSYTDEINSKQLYGIGSHTCLGRPISVYTWNRLSNILSQSQKTIHPSALSVEDREPFTIPTKCLVNFK